VLIAEVDNDVAAAARCRWPLLAAAAAAAAAATLIAISTTMIITFV